MFRNIYIEHEIEDHPRTQSILKRVKAQSIKKIPAMEEVWGRVKKPYLQKRDSLDLFIARKKGQLVKEAPQAYGHGEEKHYYFIHAYNCIYECEYCYLQGHFNTPDIVFFINHEDIIDQMQKILEIHPDAWFHAGEFSDSLALSHITNELSLYYEFFAQYPQAKMEIRTKSVNTRALEALAPLNNVIISFSLASHQSGQQYDLKCPSIKARLAAVDKLVQKGHPIGIHFDPIVYQQDFETAYGEVISQLSNKLPNQQLAYISLGVVRFTPDVFHQVQKNYPESDISKQDYIKSFDGKLRYNHPMRMWMMNKIREQLLPHYDENKIYLCMED